MQNKDFHIKEILDYLDNKMSERDAYVFERRMEADPFLMDAVEGYQNMSSSEIEKELLKLRARIKQKDKLRIVPVWMRVAAAILILLGAGTLWMIDQRKQTQGLVTDRLEVQNKKAQKDEPPVFSKKKKGEIDSIEESVDEILETKEQMSLQQIVASPSSEKPKANKSFAQAKRLDQELSLKDKKPLPISDTMLLMEEESEDFLANVDIGTVENDEINQPRAMMIRGTSSLSSDTLLVFFRGRVVDESGMPLPGVSVTHSILGGLRSEALADNSAISDMDGNFAIKAPQNGAILQLSYIGFKDKIAVVKDDSLGEVMMEPDQMALNEVVVGYGTQRKKRNAKNSAVVNEEVSNVKSVDSILLPEPDGGIKKLVRKIERSMRYPDIPKGEKIKVIVELFVSTKGEVLKVQAEPQIDAAFLLQIEGKLKAETWTPSTINGVPIESSRKLVFEFMGE